MKTKHTTHSEQELREHLKSIFSKHVSLYGTSELMIDDILLLIQSEREKVLEEVIENLPEKDLEEARKHRPDDSVGFMLGWNAYEDKLIANLAQKEEKT